ncbi:putative two-component response regulator transcriptional regulatory protein [Pandoraea terrae]|uniref:Putative two-component response regulator transcriptional regulatory protein n=1 Tax=Pandoraea terrae TaxID=1537710 RepID=A0A5E4V5V3_9BURK|nr:response regulator transcription factor [Pandoraea terrae]VVE06769.1 putative two-component response regulator transcriptional regulatory protein [Pandoraea terrae]
MPKILVVEDDRQTSAEIAAALSDHGFAVETADNGRSGLLMAAANTYDAIVLDRMLPAGMDGLAVLATLRGAQVETPVLILSALSAIDDKVRGLRAGGDDYLTKPFDSLELTARLDALMRRRVPAQVVTEYRFGGMHLDLLTRTLRRGDTVISLLPREYSLLEYLVCHAGQVVTRTMIFEAVWDYRYDERTNVIDVHVSRLRKKLDPDNRLPMIHTVRGSGYIFRAPA